MARHDTRGSTNLHRIRWGYGVRATIACVLMVMATRTAGAQDTFVTPLQLTVGRAYPITTPSPLTHVSVTNPDVADIVVISERELVINAKTPGETDALVW